MSNTSFTPLRVAAPVDSVDWTKLPVGSKFRYARSWAGGSMSDEYIVRRRKDDALWVTKTGARSRGLYLHRNGELSLYDASIPLSGPSMRIIIPHSVDLPANTRKAIDGGLDLSWLPSGTLIQDCYNRTYVIVAPRDDDKIDDFPIRSDRFDPNAGVFVPALTHTASLHYTTYRRSTRSRSDFRSETAILPSMGWTGRGVWQWEDGRLICKDEADVVVSAEAYEFLSWEAAI